MQGGVHLKALAPIQIATIKANIIHPVSIANPLVILICQWVV